MSTQPLPREPNMYEVAGMKLGLRSAHDQADLAAAVHRGLPLRTIDALMRSGLTDDEVYRLVIPRRTLAHRRAKHQVLSQEESDRAVRIARLVAFTEHTFGDSAKAGRWLRKPKQRFAGKTPMEMLETEAGSRLVEEMLYQAIYGIFA